MLKENEIKVGDVHTATLVEDLKRTKLMLMNNKKMERLKKLFESNTNVHV